MAKDGGDFIASWAEVGIGVLRQELLVFPLLFWRGMKEENLKEKKVISHLSERHIVMVRSSLLESITV